MTPFARICRLILFIGLAACAPAAGVQSPASSPTPLPPAAAEPTAIPSTPAAKPERPAPGDLPAGAVLRLQRSGGFAGSEDEWVLYADGRLEQTTRQAAAPTILQVEPEAAAALLETLLRLGFFNLQETNFVPRDRAATAS